MYPQAKWHVYEPVNRDNVLEGAKMAFGAAGRDSLRFVKGRRNRLARRRFLVRRISPETRATSATSPSAAIPMRNMNRLYVIESTPTTTGAKADHRLPLRAVEIEGFARDRTAHSRRTGYSRDISMTQSQIRQQVTL